MLGFCALAPLGDGIAKLIGDRVPLVQLLALRFAIQALVLAPVVVLAGTDLRLSPSLLALVALRTALHVVGIGAMFLSLRYLPLADAIAIAFVMPFVLLLLGWLALGEEVGPRRLAACAVGFAGTLLVVQPSFAAVGAPALLPLLVAVTFALFLLVTRAIARAVDPVALQAVSGGMAAAILLPVVLLAAGHGIPEVSAIRPSGADWALIAAMGLIGTAGHLLMTWSLRFAPASTLAPMQYLEIPFATLVGFVLFGDLPNGLAALGIAVTVAAGLYVIHREHRLSREVSPARTDPRGSRPRSG
jgi:drug/metabolite transporter (DMT)-like permease